MSQPLNEARLHRVLGERRRRGHSQALPERKRNTRQDSFAGLGFPSQPAAISFFVASSKECVLERSIEQTAVGCPALDERPIETRSKGQGLATACIVETMPEGWVRLTFLEDDRGDWYEVVRIAMPRSAFAALRASEPAEPPPLPCGQQPHWQ